MPGIALFAKGAPPPVSKGDKNQEINDTSSNGHSESNSDHGDAARKVSFVEGTKFTERQETKRRLPALPSFGGGSVGFGSNSTTLGFGSSFGSMSSGSSGVRIFDVAHTILRCRLLLMAHV